MVADLVASKRELVEEALHAALRRAGARTRDVDRFLRAGLGRAQPDDLLGRDPAEVAGAGLALWELAQRRRRGEPAVAVYVPEWEQHGWSSPHTVVQVVTDDVPFVVDSVLMVFERRELAVHVMVHAQMRLHRDDRGNLIEVRDRDEDSSGGAADDSETVIHLEVDRLSDGTQWRALAEDLRSVLGDVGHAYADQGAMRERLEDAAVELESGPASRVVDGPERSETVAFLRWLGAEHFTLLGSRMYRLATDNGEEVLRSVPGSGLGILRDEDAPAPTVTRLSAEASRAAHEPTPLVLTKTNARSTVHRPDRLDYVGVKVFAEDGRVRGERRFLGLYTRRAAAASCLDIPMVREGLRRMLRTLGFPEDSHEAANIVALADELPRDLLFQVPLELVVEEGRAAAAIERRRQVRLFPFREAFGRFYHCVLYLPRDRYNTTSRQRVEQILMEALGGTEAEFTVSVGESPMARVLYVVWTATVAPPELDVPALEAQLTDAIRSWAEELREALIEACGEERGCRLYLRYRQAFPPAYQEDFPPRLAVAEVDRLERLAEMDDTGIVTALYRPISGRTAVLRFKVLHAGGPLTLSDTLPVLENLGVRVLDERPYQISPRDRAPVWIYDLGLDLPDTSDRSLDREAFQEAFGQVWCQAVDNDGLNRLVLAAGLGWRDIVVLRSLAAYLRQIGATFTPAYVADCLTAHPRIARDLVALFHARFDPSLDDSRGRDRDAHAAEVVDQITVALDEVASLDQDRILRRFLQVIQAVTRTTHFQAGADGVPHPYLALKIASGEVDSLPAPVPEREVFVFSPAGEGVHLRGGPVARGGIRWSDRREDVRTEILGLLKAQNVKNSVIVPTGAKGGFVVKHPVTADRDAVLAQATDCYRTFISGLLDLTDNLVDGEVVPPSDVVRYDADDSYLVVAADKGTATFSDIANELATNRGFWLGDAFASGGSTGYDHKRMGITARGAWISVQRHFHQLGVDPQTSDITVIGIGDMSGDVFGNGMLCSEHIRLVGAFDHRHVFLDPDPDPAASFAERRRLFGLPRSSWADYDTTVLSAGGGVFDRSQKTICISDQARERLDITAERLTPDELIQSLLRAPVDLLWNGGIGTYIKASTQTHAEVGDRSTDPVRIDATELRCRVIGEGGNLGLTQPARIEFAQHGGRINTDAVDNSAGVDCSDHEVNIKIALNHVVADGELTVKQRNRLLAEMTEEVAELVLATNHQQTHALVLATAQAPGMLQVHTRYLRHLEHTGMLNRHLEHLPSDDDLADRAATSRGLTSPEFAVLMAYTTRGIYQDLLDSDVPDDPYLERILVGYFPTPLRDTYPDQLCQHPLRREIIATVLANYTVHRAGTTFAFRLCQETTTRYAEVARAHLAVTDMLGLDPLRQQILECGPTLSASVQTRMLLQVRKLAERATRWLLRTGPRALDLSSTISAYTPDLEILTTRLPELFTPAQRRTLDATAAGLTADGVPEDLAATVARLEELYAGPDIARIARALDRPVEQVAAIHFQLAEYLELDWLRQAITELPRDEYWRSRARTALRDELDRTHADLTTELLRDTSPDDPADVPAIIDRWEATTHHAALDRYHAALSELRHTPTDLPHLYVTMRELPTLHSTEPKNTGQ